MSYWDKRDHPPILLPANGSSHAQMMWVGGIAFALVIVALLIISLRGPLT